MEYTITNQHEGGEAMTVWINDDIVAVLSTLDNDAAFLKAAKPIVPDLTLVAWLHGQGYDMETTPYCCDWCDHLGRFRERSCGHCGREV